MTKKKLKIDVVDGRQVLHFRNLDEEQLKFLAKAQGLVENKPLAKVIDMPKKMTYEEFIDKVCKEVIPNRDKGIREGQALMNYLHEIWPEEYKRLVEDNNLDCFYRDDIVPFTLVHLQKQWNRYPN